MNNILRPLVLGLVLALAVACALSGCAATAPGVPAAVLAATRAQGAQVGFMNLGGMRSDFDVAGDLTATLGRAYRWDSTAAPAARIERVK